MTDKKFFTIQSSAVEVGIDISQINASFSDIKKKFLLNSSPRHSCEISNFSISKKLISYKEFNNFIIDTNYITDAEKDGWGWMWNKGWVKKSGVNFKNPFSDKADEIYKSVSEIPVLQISWNDASAFCIWHSEKFSKSARLPSEIEWEAASGMFESFSFNNIDGKNIINENIFSDSVEFMNYLAKISVSEFSPAGILWEWTSDWFDSYSPEIVNKDFGKIYKVLRGGSLLSEPYQKCAEYRFRRCPTARSPYYGFRIVVDI